MEACMYYFLNIIDKVGKRNADDWIGKEGFAPFFYGSSTLKQLRDGSADLKKKVKTYSRAIFGNFWWRNY
jgi:hypothetical protein